MSVCQEEPETTLHLFLDCNRVKPLWFQCVASSLQASFFALDYHPWVLGNLQNESLLPLESRTVPSFDPLLWLIWTMR